MADNEPKGTFSLFNAVFSLHRPESAPHSHTSEVNRFIIPDSYTSPHTGILHYALCHVILSIFCSDGWSICPTPFMVGLAR